MAQDDLAGHSSTLTAGQWGQPAWDGCTSARLQLSCSCRCMCSALSPDGPWLSVVNQTAAQGLNHTRREPALPMCILGSSCEMLSISDGRTSSTDRLLRDFWMPVAACTHAWRQPTWEAAAWLPCTRGRQLEACSSSPVLCAAHRSISLLRTHRHLCYILHCSGHFACQDHQQEAGGR